MLVQSCSGMGSGMIKATAELERASMGCFARVKLGIWKMIRYHSRKRCMPICMVIEIYIEGMKRA